jgi:CspA family cold shock protein
MVKGTIKRILSIRGFGFIEREGEDKDLYFHWSKTQDDFYYLREGDEVEFDVEETQNGPQAVNVTSII